MLLIVAAGGLAAYIAGRNTQAQAEQTAHLQVEQAFALTLSHLRTTDALMLDRVKAGMALLMDLGAETGAPQLRTPLRTVGSYTVPDLRLGRTSQTMQYNLVDAVARLQGGTATLFVKSGDDFVRVSTNVKKDDGARAIGTILSRTGRAIEAIRQGKAYYGVVDILGQPYITGYEPMRNVEGETIGIWYVGYKLSTLAELGRMIESRSILSDGFVAVVDNQGRTLFHSEHVSSDLIDTARHAQASGENGTWVTAAKSFDPWGYRVEIAYPERVIAEASQAALLKLALATVLGVLLMIGVVYGFVRLFITAPLHRLSSVAERIAGGDHSARIDLSSDDEIGRLGHAFNGMVESLSLVMTEAETQRKDAEAARSASERQEAYLTERVDEMLEAMDRFAQGDLSVYLRPQNDDEVSRLFEGFNQAVRNMRQMLYEVHRAITSASGISARIAASTEELSASAEQQCSQAQEVAMAAEQMTQTITTNSQGATQTAAFTRSSMEIAQEGGSIVHQTIDKIDAIAGAVQAAAGSARQLQASSDEMGKVVGTINNITKQINLLALNATIEAARAGDHGKGFAVVANEVRQLATQTSEATEQIAHIIASVQHDADETAAAMERGDVEVSAGLALADQANEALLQIIESTEETTKQVNQIAAANVEQSSTSDAIVQSVESILAAASHSADEVARVAEGTSEMDQSMEHLRTQIARFNIEAFSADDPLYSSAWPPAPASPNPIALPATANGGAPADPSPAQGDGVRVGPPDFPDDGDTIWDLNPSDSTALE